MQLIFNTQSWTELHDGIRGAHDLESLARQLPDIIQQSRAPSTVNQYSSTFLRWKNWADTQSKSALPADPFIISLYLVHLGNTALSPAPISNSLSAISWAHRLSNLADPTKSSIVTNTAEGLKRTLSKLRIKKDPITAELLREMVAIYAKDKSPSNLLLIRTLTMCLISFAGFLRFNELVKIKVGHVRFFDSHISILIEQSKTDQYREGTRVIISRTFAETCPVAMLELYYRLAKISLVDSSNFLFRNLTKTNKGYIFRNGNQPMSYTRVRELILEVLTPLVGDVSKYCIHSLRSGGASAAANAGVPDRNFKRHGRWKSETAKDGYVQDNFSSLLSVSQSLGL